MRAFAAVNLTVRFLLELCALGALAWWGATRGLGTVGNVLLALGVTAVAAVLWGSFVSPKAVERGVPPAVRWTVEVVVFVAAAAALVAVGHPVLAATLAVVYVANRLLLQVAGDAEQAFGR